MPNTSAIGVTVRHAIARALATANLAPAEATYRVLSARAWPRRDGSVGRANVTLQMREAQPIHRWEARDLEGWVNPDGEHPNMVLVPLADPLFVDIFPVTWDRWLQHTDEWLPEHIDTLVPRSGLEHAQALDFAARLDRRLPTTEEFKALWGPERFPWGKIPDPGLGYPRSPRFGQLHEVGAHPPTRGLYDLGAWLWHFMADGSVSGGVKDGQPSFGVALQEAPVGFRCVCDP